MTDNYFNKIFGKLPIIGMIHLAGPKPAERALEEIAIYEKEEVDGAIIENYHSSIIDVERTLKALKGNTSLTLGVNILPNHFYISFELAEEYKASFIQLDYVAGRYTGGTLNENIYSDLRKKFKDIAVLGGVWPKYYTPVLGSSLEDDLKKAIGRTEAIVVTGKGTGKETPVNKISEFRRIIGEHPLIVGAGLTLQNAWKQLMIADGAIVGSYFKRDNNTYNHVEREMVNRFMRTVNEIRKKKEENSKE